MTRGFDHIKKHFCSRIVSHPRLLGWQCVLQLARCCEVSGCHCKMKWKSCCSRATAGFPTIQRRSTVKHIERESKSFNPTCRRGKSLGKKENKDHNIYYNSCKVWLLLLPDDYKIIWKTFSNKLNKSFRGLLVSCWSSPPSPGSVCVCVHWRVYYRVRVRVLVRWTTCTAPRVWNGWPGGCQNDGGVFDSDDTNLLLLVMVEEMVVLRPP